MLLDNYSELFKLSYGILIFPTLLVVISALLSAKEMGGTLGQGLKKIAAGSIFDSILLMTYILLEKGNLGLLSESQITAFFIVAALLGATLLVVGYIQIYKISKKLKLFTP